MAVNHKVTTEQLPLGTMLSDLGFTSPDPAQGYAVKRGRGDSAAWGTTWVQAGACYVDGQPVTWEQFAAVAEGDGVAAWWLIAARDLSEGKWTRSGDDD